MEILIQRLMSTTAAGQTPRRRFLHRLTEKREIAHIELLAADIGYLTAAARHKLSGHLDYEDRYYIDKWFQII